MTTIHKVETKPYLVTLPIQTRVPSKYLLIDRETGDVWQWRDGGWKQWLHPGLDNKIEAGKVEFDFENMTVSAPAVSRTLLVKEVK